MYTHIYISMYMYKIIVIAPCCNTWTHRLTVTQLQSPRIDFPYSKFCIVIPGLLWFSPGKCHHIINATCHHSSSRLQAQKQMPRMTSLVRLRRSGCDPNIGVVISHLVTYRVYTFTVWHWICIFICLFVYIHIHMYI